MLRAMWSGCPNLGPASQMRPISAVGPANTISFTSHYRIICLGVAIANFSVAYVLLTGMHIFLLMYRARLEETQLAEHSAEYREYTKHTGFILPKLWRTAGS